MKSGSKPFQELLNASGQQPQDTYCFEGYVVDRLQWQVHWQGEPIPLHRKSFDLLLLLIENHTRVVSKDEIFQAIWPDQFVEENNLSQQVFLLRKALSRHGAGNKIIETVPGRGYRFAAKLQMPEPPHPAAGGPQVVTEREVITSISVEEVEEIEASGEPQASGQGGADAQRTVPVGATQRRRRAVWAWVAGACSIAVLGLLAWRIWQYRQRLASGPAVQVMLMPLEGTTGDLALDHALADAMRMDMAQSPVVSLASPSLVSRSLEQMKRKADSPMDAGTARELCERTNSQAVVRGTLAATGSQFLFTMTAVGCVNEDTIAADKREVSRKEDLPTAIDRLTNEVRRALGESRASIGRFNTQIYNTEFTTSASLDALKAEDQGVRLEHAGRYAQAALLQEHAISLDPKFALAYYDLSLAYHNQDDFLRERQALTHAHDLRDTVSPLTGLMIEARYHASVTGDLYAAERIYRSWASMYPRSMQAWNGLTVVQAQLGESEAKASAERAIALVPDIADLYIDLAEQYIMQNDPAMARQTCERAIAAGLDSEEVRVPLMMAGYLEGNAGALQAQRAWLADHPQSPSLLTSEAQIATAEGRFADADRMLDAVMQFDRQQDSASSGAAVLKLAGRALAEAGEPVAGATRFRGQTVDPQSGDDAVALATIGDLATANRLVEKRLAEAPNDTLWKQWYGPLVRGKALMKQRRYQEAVAALEPTRQIELHGFDATYLRGQALLAAGQPQAAEKEFLWIMAHPGLDPFSVFKSLAFLSLARTLAAEGQPVQAKEAYRQFLDRWSNADSSAADLKAARLELAGLQVR